VKDLTRVLARNVRQLRQDRGLTAAELATRSGVAKATLSQIEAARGNPRLETLRDLAEALGVAPTELLAPPDEPRVRVVRRDEGLDITDSVMGGRLVRSIAVEASVIEVYELALGPAASETSASHGIGAHEHVFVLEGTVELGPVEARTQIGERDLASYPADRPHGWRTRDDEHARVLVLQIMPRPRAAG
jgi:XRE family transcriptional regulator, regulator of sulfur utilization